MPVALVLGEARSGRLTVSANRMGMISEISAFLLEFEAAYTSLLYLESWLQSITPSRRWKRYGPPDFYWPGIMWNVAAEVPNGIPDPSTVPPDLRVLIGNVRIESPGSWEFLGALNPLLQIREYLNDRHGRRQDRAFREAAEIEKLKLENELLQRAVWEKDNAVLRERVSVLREIGYTDEEIRQLVWSVVGRPIAALGKYQDTGVIDGAE